MAGDNGAADLGEVFDLDALDTEAGKPPFRVKIHGETFTMRNLEDLPWQTQQILAGQDVGEMMRVLLAPDDWEQFRQIELPLAKVNQLMEAWAGHNGVDMGESSASSPSSAPTARTSRRTSGATTKSGSRASRRAR